MFSEVGFYLLMHKWYMEVTKIELLSWSLLLLLLLLLITKARRAEFNFPAAASNMPATFFAFNS